MGPIFVRIVHAFIHKTYPISISQIVYLSKKQFALYQHNSIPFGPIINLNVTHYTTFYATSAFV